MHVGDTLARLRREAGLSQGEAAAYLTDSGCPCTQKSVSKWERGVNLPNAEQFLLLCRLYGVRDVLHRFLGMEDSLSGLNALGRRRVEEYIRLLKGDAAFGEEAPAVRKPGRVIPLYDLPVSAGTGQFLDSSDHRLLELPEEVPRGADYAVRISGDSMEPRYADRQVVYVQRQETLEPGETGIFLYRGDAYCKVLGRDGGKPALLSLNKRYDPIRVAEEEDLRVLGRVLS